MSLIVTVQKNNLDWRELRMILFMLKEKTMLELDYNIKKLFTKRDIIRCRALSKEK